MNQEKGKLVIVIAIVVVIIVALYAMLKNNDKQDSGRVIYNTEGVESISDNNESVAVDINK